MWYATHGDTRACVYIQMLRPPRRKSPSSVVKGSESVLCNFTQDWNVKTHRRRRPPLCVRNLTPSKVETVNVRPRGTPSLNLRDSEINEISK